jgi:hypothetical protein
MGKPEEQMPCYGLGSTFARRKQCLEAIFGLLFQPGRKHSAALAVNDKGVSEQSQETGQPLMW